MWVKCVFTFLSVFISLFAAAPWANAQIVREQLQDSIINKIDTNRELSRAGADEIGVEFITDLSDSTSYTTNVFLVGLKNNKILWKKQFPLQEDINRPKTWISCKGQTIELYSQYPFTAAACIQLFSWNGDTIKFISIRYEDPSANVVEAFISAAEGGNIKKLDSLANIQKFDSLETLVVLYPHRYINGDMVANAIKRGHAAATKLFKAGKISEAANRLSLMFEVTIKLYTDTVEESEDSLKPPARWLEVWKWMDAEPKDYVYALNDYGFFLQEAGNHQAAVPIFEAVIKEDSTRIVAYLNLADSFWPLARKAEAKHNYQAYQRLMIKAGKADKIPSQVAERLKIKL